MLKLQTAGLACTIMVSDCGSWWAERQKTQLDLVRYKEDNWKQKDLNDNLHRRGPQTPFYRLPRPKIFENCKPLYSFLKLQYHRLKQKFLQNRITANPYTNFSTKCEGKVETSSSPGYVVLTAKSSTLRDIKPCLLFEMYKNSVEFRFAYDTANSVPLHVVHCLESRSHHFNKFEETYSHSYPCMGNTGIGKHHYTLNKSELK